MAIIENAIQPVNATNFKQLVEERAKKYNTTVFRQGTGLAEGSYKFQTIAGDPIVLLLVENKAQTGKWDLPCLLGTVYQTDGSVVESFTLDSIKTKSFVFPSSMGSSIQSMGMYRVEIDSRGRCTSISVDTDNSTEEQEDTTK